MWRKEKLKKTRTWLWPCWKVLSEVWWCKEALNRLDHDTGVWRSGWVLPSNCYTPTPLLIQIARLESGGWILPASIPRHTMGWQIWEVTNSKEQERQDWMATILYIVKATGITVTLLFKSYGTTDVEGDINASTVLFSSFNWKLIQVKTKRSCLNYFN